MWARLEGGSYRMARDVLATTEYTTNCFSDRPVINWWAHVLTPPVT